MSCTPQTIVSAVTAADRFMRRPASPLQKPMSGSHLHPNKPEAPPLRHSKPKHLLLKVVEGVGRYCWDVRVSSWWRYA